MMIATASVMLIGCIYESPLTKEHQLAIDPEVLGVWEPIQSKDDKTQANERMVILKYSDTEYLIHYPPGGRDEGYYRGYPIKIGGLRCVQLQIIGTNDGPPQQDVNDLFHVASYRLMNERLEIRMLNTDVVSENLKTTEALRKGFLKHKNNKMLFNDPAAFRKVSQ
jgi:hypothetical protein